MTSVRNGKMPWNNNSSQEEKRSKKISQEITKS